MQPIKDPTTQQVVPGNAFSPSLASPMGAAMLNFFPLPNRCDLNNNATGCYNEADTSQIYTRNFRNEFTGKRARRNDVLRFDANITSKLTTFFRYINDYDMSQESAGISLKTAAGTVGTVFGRSSQPRARVRHRNHVHHQPHVGERVHLRQELQHLGLVPARSLHDGPGADE